MGKHCFEEGPIKSFNLLKYCAVWQWLISVSWINGICLKTFVKQSPGNSNLCLRHWLCISIWQLIMGSQLPISSAVEAEKLLRVWILFKPWNSSFCSSQETSKTSTPCGLILCPYLFSRDSTSLWVYTFWENESALLCGWRKEGSKPSESVLGWVGVFLCVVGGGGVPLCGDEGGKSMWWGRLY